MRYIGFMEKNTIKPIKRVSLKEEVYLTLKHAIVSLQLQPGERLHDQKLAEQFNISRTPVREALKRLEDEGLVESNPGSYTKVTPLNIEEAKHAFIVVAALHALAARLAVHQIGEYEIQELQLCNEAFAEAIENKNAIKAMESDRAFHAVFLKLAGNREIENALKGCTSKIYRLEISQFTTEMGRKSVVQHEKIIVACHQKNFEAAVHLVEDNWLMLGDWIK